MPKQTQPIKLPLLTQFKDWCKRSVGQYDSLGLKKSLRWYDRNAEKLISMARWAQAQYANKHFIDSCQIDPLKPLMFREQNNSDFLLDFLHYIDDLLIKKDFEDFTISELMNVAYVAIEGRNQHIRSLCNTFIETYKKWYYTDKILNQIKP